ncbi:hypothetical protein [Cohnella terricola]|uniref:Uncharacterized protein n=1 Tax=Cohnella terricola TaxID=1289167 RepID=A0A559J8S2_9BACL|nr:hypothetical protein [Cohnella terricola]TVX96289.1 hypothetical protein FPZ45_21525 [Cohnella terricola]
MIIIYSWLSDYVEPEKSDLRTNHGSIYLKRIQTESPDSITETATFFITHSMIASIDTLVCLPIRNEQSKKLILGEVAVHFEDVKLVFSNGQLELINMRIVKEKSRDLFNSSTLEIRKITFDLYRTKDMSNWVTPHKRSFSYYTIKNDNFEKLALRNTERLQQYIYDEYFSFNETLCLLPNGWIFQENLKDSLCLRFFVSFIPTINLWIDNEKNEVALIELFKKPL